MFTWSYYRLTCNWSPESTSSNRQRRKDGRNVSENKRHARPLDIYAIFGTDGVCAQQTEVSAKRRAERAVAFVAPVESAAPTVEEKRKRKRRETETEVDGDREPPKERKKKKKRAKLEEEGGGS